MIKKSFLYVSSIIIFIALIMLVFFVPKEVYAYSKVKPLSINFQGIGTIESPYQIKSKEDFKTLTNLVNEGSNYENEYFVLTKDIDFEGETLQPIGNFANPFKGNFDGCGYFVSNVNIQSNNSNDLGLFGYVVGSEIKNLGVKNINIVALDITSEYGSDIACGGLIAQAEQVTIDNCFVSNDEDNEISVSSYLYIYAGGLIGRLTSGSHVSNCYADIDVCAKSSSSLDTRIYIGGLVGYCDTSTIKDVYSLGKLNAGSNGTQNLQLTNIIGGVVGYIEGNLSALINTFFAGDIKIENENDSGYIKGGIIGEIASNPAVIPSAGNLNYCHYLKNTSKNDGINAVGFGSSYSMTNIKMVAWTDDIFFKSETEYKNQNYYNLYDAFDFENVWLIENSYPTLQQFAFYEIEVEQIDNCSLEIVGGEEVSSNVRKFKAGTTVKINAKINSSLEKFYHIKSWRRNQSEISNTQDMTTYEFTCNYLTKGKYNVVLQANKFTLKVTIPTEFKSVASLKYFASPVGSATFQKELLYGRDVSLEAVLGTSDEAQNYAFRGWYYGENAENRLNWDSSILTFSIGDETVPFDDDLCISLTASFTRDICRFSLDYNNEMGQVKLYSSDEFTSEEISNKPIQKGQLLSLEAQALEGYQFDGWFKTLDDAVPACEDLVYEDYLISEDTQILYAKFSLIGDENSRKSGLSTWAIVGIILGCLAVGGIVALIVVLVKRKGSYKSNFHF